MVLVDLSSISPITNLTISNLADNGDVDSFEHSLVEELGYDGYARLRRGFDRAFGGRENLPTFSTVLDAGCGTGLVGEQVRSIRLNAASHLKLTIFDDNLIDEQKGNAKG